MNDGTVLGTVFSDAFRVAPISVDNWRGLSLPSSEVWNYKMLQTGDKTTAVTISQLPEAFAMGGQYSVTASFTAHPDHYTDDDAMIMLCTANNVVADWTGHAGCVKFLLWDEYTNFYGN
jgi:hypothetical protein